MITAPASLTAQIATLEADSSLFAQQQLRRIQEIFLEKAPIGGVIARLLGMTPKFDWVNDNITDEHFPATAEPSLEGACLEESYGEARQASART